MTNVSTPKVAVFYHVYQYGDWAKLVNEQLGLLKSSGLYDRASFIYIGINGDKPFPFKGEKLHVKRNPAPWLEETPTLKSLEAFCQENDDWQILYFHTKGITTNSPPVTDWRKTMEYFCIERWRECLKNLETNDTVGCLYVDECYLGPYRYYGGNFWWTKSEYVQTLNKEFLDSTIRQHREFWIGTGDGTMFSFLDSGLNHYISMFPRENYAPE